MAQPEVNKLLMRAVSDNDFRAKFLSDPIAAAKDAGANSATVAELKKIDVARLRAQFDHLTRVSGDLLAGSVVAAGHSRDWSDRSNIHDNDGHIHDKAASVFSPGDLVTNPGVSTTLNPAAVRDALKDPLVLKEIENNPQIKAALKRGVK
ncbi:hypothetical protein JW897_06975 [Chromobacterium alkanivorans]|uniref:Os1348 family NHLP clan protein n=1 Tax=Chromobacterium alkanivorans TaxID=1071719 RepID=UPI00196732FE|nr:Os1348 family NHLP clan protein [Chromobacterium alkanivorans]MBN3003477.1 hypothetical protein [Chromobacterium alkanivorans]